MSFSFPIKSLALIALLPLAVSAAQPLTNPISPDAVRGHVEFLASDLLEGRETGHRGYDIAASYVAGQYRTIGLQPASTSGWYQQVPFLATMTDNQASAVTINGKRFENRKDVLFGAGRSAGAEQLEAPVVFAGYGIDDPKNGQNDYAGLDVKGKLVAVLWGFPKGMKSDMGAHYSRSKAKMAEARGAIGVITVRTAERERVRTWSREIEGPQHPTLGWTEADGRLHTETPTIKAGVTLHDAAANALFAGAPKPLATILAEADKKGGRPKGFALKHSLKLDRTTTASTITSPNVVGVLPGSDPALANEYVLIMGHLDHVGVDPARKDDTIFNGALDNASGIGAMLEAARLLAAGPRPRRSIMFAAVTAEEKGLLGSDYLASNPALSNGGKVVGVVNLDMPVLLYDFKDVIAFGAEHSTMGDAVARAGARMGVSLSPDPIPGEGLFTRSDHYSFVKKGVPSVFLMTGFQNGGEAQFKGFLATHYHKVTDDLALPIDWQAAAKFAWLNALIAAEVANGGEAPKWYLGSFFGNLFAPDAPKVAMPVAGK